MGVLSGPKDESGFGWEDCSLRDADSEQPDELAKWVFFNLRCTLRQRGEIVNVLPRWL